MVLTFDWSESILSCMLVMTYIFFGKVENSYILHVTFHVIK